MADNIYQKLTDEQCQQLDAKLSPDVVKQRQQGNFKASYVEGHYVIRKANEIFGFDGWTRQTLSMECIHNDVYKGKKGDGWLVAYIAHVQITLYLPDTEPRVTTGYGYGEGIDYSNPGQAHESAVKEAETDAMKRALIKYGDQFGLALYDKDKQHVGHDNPEEEQEPQKQEPDTLGDEGKAKFVKWLEGKPEPVQLALTGELPGFLRERFNVDTVDQVPTSDRLTLMGWAEQRAEQLAEAPEEQQAAEYFKLQEQAEQMGISTQGLGTAQLLREEIAKVENAKGDQK